MNGKKWTFVLVPLIVFLLGQLLLAVWWASSVDTKLKRLPIIEKAINDGMADRYTGDDADRDWQRQGDLDRRQDDRVNELHNNKDGPDK